MWRTKFHTPNSNILSGLLRSRKAEMINKMTQNNLHDSHADPYGISCRFSVAGENLYPDTGNRITLKWSDPGKGNRITIKWLDPDTDNRITLKWLDPGTGNRITLK
jgi:hypothetical protein